jgi:hypothetical protein
MYRPDVVHFHDLFPLLSPASLRIASSGRPAIVTSLHNYQLQTGLGDGNQAELCCLT